MFPCLKLAREDWILKFLMVLIKFAYTCIYEKVSPFTSDTKQMFGV